MPNPEKGKGRGNGQFGDANSDLDRDMVRWTRAVAAFTFLLFVTSAVSDWFIYQEWEGAGIREERNVEQLRAVVVVESTVLSPAHDLKGNKTVGFTTTFRNIGGTRTARFRAWNSVQYFKDDIPNNFDPTQPNAKVDLSDTVTGANLTNTLAPAGLSDTDFEQALAQTGKLVIWGNAVYADIFSPKVDISLSFLELIS